MNKARAALSFPPALLRDAAGGDDALVAELLDIFLRTVPSMARRFADALEAGTASAVAQEAHDLKGCLVLVGAAAVSLDFARAEFAARRDGACPTGAEGAMLCAKLHDVVEQVRRHLDSQA